MVSVFLSLVHNIINEGDAESLKKYLKTGVMVQGN